MSDEFAHGAFDERTGLSRRESLKLMAAAALWSQLSACSDQPTEHIVPHVRNPHGATQGQSRQFSTTLTRGRSTLGVLVDQYEGRPFKIEGNPDHPSSRGKTDIFAQAELLTLCDPQRSQAVLHQQRITTWDHFSNVLNQQLAQYKASGGTGLHILTGPISSPTQHDLREQLSQLYPRMQWYVHDPIDATHEVVGLQQLFGQPLQPVYRFDQADVILSLDADFLFALPGSVRYASDFAQRRRIRQESADRLRMNRLYVAEPAVSLTGAKADHHLAVSPEQLGALAISLMRQLGMQLPGNAIDARNEAIQRWLNVLAQDLRNSGSRALVLAGASQPPVIHAFAHAINAHLGSIGSTVHYIEPITTPITAENSITQLSEQMHRGEVSLLIISGCNPVYDAGQNNFAKALQQVPLTIHHGLYHDETSQQCHWHLPMAHELEAWGDARGHDGTAGIIQPLIAPLYAGRSFIEILAMMKSPLHESGYNLVRNYWRQQQDGASFERWWNNVLQRGVIPDSASVPVDIDATRVASALLPALSELNSPFASDSSTITYCLRPDYTMWDGRYSNNAWLQELPDPFTKIVWDNCAWMSPATAGRFQLNSEDLITLSARDYSLQLPVWIVPGIADNTVILPTGYGRTAAGEVGNHVGRNVYPLRESASAMYGLAELKKNTGHHRLACTQNHHRMEGRHLVHTGSYAQLLDDPESIVHSQSAHHQDSSTNHGSDNPVHLSLYPERGEYKRGQQWGMVIDLTTCIGCNACTIACQSENNIPVVGKREVEMGREMHWIRIDRYWQTDAHNRHQTDSRESTVHFQPLPCMHCEQAPCEVVCPVGATLHSTDGLNEMTYNRCVGTRYCSNNCPYKVRRFNFLRYTDYKTESLKIMRNPDVTLRARGVMEKCTYCVQRIRRAQIDADLAGHTTVADGQIHTACSQVCPTEAIVFGDINDPDTQVSKVKHEPINYGLLEDLNTQPRTSYLAEIRNPNPQLM